MDNELQKITTFLDQAQKAAKLGIWTVDIQTREMTLSSNAQTLLQIESEMFMIDDLLLLVCEIDMSKVLKLFEEALEYGIGFETEFRIQRPNGFTVFSLIAQTEFRDGSSTLYGTLQDITETARSRDIMREYFHIIDTNVLVSKTDLSGIITYVSQSFADISGYTKEELIGSHQNIVRHPDMPEETFSELWQSIHAGKIWHGEIKNQTKDGKTYWVDTTISPTYDHKNQITGYMAIRQLITDKKLIENLVITDPLTELFNRRHFSNIASQEILRARRDKKSFAFAILDIDNFKLYNDTYGHQAGDDVLISIAKALRQSFKRSSDYVFRLGGEEFGIILSDTHSDTLIYSMELARSNIENLSIEHRLNHPKNVVTGSFGMVIVHHEEKFTHIDTLYKKADEELYKAKALGRNQICTRFMTPKK